MTPHTKLTLTTTHRRQTWTTTLNALHYAAQLINDAPEHPDTIEMDTIHEHQLDRLAREISDLLATQPTRTPPP